VHDTRSAQEGVRGGTAARTVDAILAIPDARVCCGTEIDHVAVLLDLMVADGCLRHSVLQE